MTYAIRHKRSGKWVYGTDYRYHPYHQKTSHDKAILFDSYESAHSAYRFRLCGKDYEIVAVKIEEAERKEE